jgi:hypothetical protein
LNAKFSTEFLKNIIIGVQVDATTKRGLKSLANESNGEFYDVSDSDIENIFQKISISLGIVTKTAIIGINDGDRQAILAA